eukprot:maker-scaffold716_size107355-snap-gene-0.28 protein:Tk05815 transcript:maker-scaffold716_size107355-snap-gene-0.28-mRNA-1 annotation:"protein smaug homolog 2"
MAPPPLGSTLASVGSQHSEAEKQIDEMVSQLPEGSGMKELHLWLKSLRLHKYTTFLLEFTYEELLGMTSEQLPKDRVTEGAKGKILKEIKLINERPATVRKVLTVLEEIFKLDDLARLEKILPEIEKIVLMPLKPLPNTGIALPMRCSSESLQGPYKWPNSSGMESILDLSGDESKPTSLNRVPGCGLGLPMIEENENIPQSIFEVLKKVCSIVLLSDCPVPKTVSKVVKNISSLLEQCIEREAYHLQQKQCFRTWLKALRNPNALRSIRNQQFSRDVPTMTTPARRLSGAVPLVHRPSTGFVRGPAPVGMHLTGGGVNPPTCMMGLSSPLGMMMPDGHENSFVNLQRRSVPEITSPSLAFTQPKRNSYQGDSRLPGPGIDLRPFSTADFFADHFTIQSPLCQLCHFDPLSDPQFNMVVHCSGILEQAELTGLIPNFLFQIHLTDSEILSSLLDCDRRESTYSCDSGYYLSLPDSRRNSSLSSLDGSRRNSSLASSDDSRRNSFFEDMPHRDSFFGSGMALSGQLDTSRGMSSGIPGACLERRDSGLPHETRNSLSVGAGQQCRALGGESMSSCGTLASSMGSFASSESSGKSQEEIHNMLQLNQDLHNISLSVTKQALEEN